MTATSTTSGLSTRQRSREQRLTLARERRLQQDPDRLAREQRMDEATVDIEDAWAARHDAEVAVATAERVVARALARLLAEKLPVTEIADLTGLDASSIRRLLRLAESHQPGMSRAGPGGLP